LSKAFCNLCKLRQFAQSTKRKWGQNNYHLRNRSKADYLKGSDEVCFNFVKHRRWTGV